MHFNRRVSKFQKNIILIEIILIEIVTELLTGYSFIIDVLFHTAIHPCDKWEKVHV